MVGPTRQVGSTWFRRRRRSAGRELDLSADFRRFICIYVCV